MDIECNWGPADRILVVAPHPDDELLAAGGLLADAARAGAYAHIAVVTNGDGFSWAARTHYKRPVVSQRGYINFGVKRSEESLAAISHLGLPRSAITFLGYPDRGIAAIWERHWSRKGRLFRSPFTRTETNPYPHSFRPGAPYCGESLVEDLRSIILAHRPTLIIGPHAHDSHIDHWATHNFLVYTVEMLADEGLPRPDLWFYLTHRGEWPSPRGLRPGRRLMPPASLLEVGGEWLSVPLSPRAVEQKKIGLRAYRTQVALLRQYLNSFVAQNEVFSCPKTASLAGGASVEVPVSAREEAVWAIPEAHVANPQRDTVKRNLFGSADIRSLWVALDGADVLLSITLRRPPSARVSYDIWVMTFYDRTDPLRGHQFRFSFTPPRKLRVTHASGPAGLAEASAKAEVFGEGIRLRVPRWALGWPSRLFVGARTRAGFLTIDWSAWRLVRLPEEAAAEAPRLAASHADGAPFA